MTGNKSLFENLAAIATSRGEYRKFHFSLRPTIKLNGELPLRDSESLNFEKQRRGLSPPGEGDCLAP
jgi:hypothetical protein